MKVTGLTRELKQQISARKKGLLGLVPTMGALHEGHLSLVTQAFEKCGTIVVSIFVNPTQFNDKNDLKNYPRTIAGDLRLLSTVLRDDDIVFTPSESEMYPEEDTRKFNFGNLDKVMEATLRPGHFNGVAQIVSKLFDIVNPDLAFFGQKDFQQVAVIKSLVKQMNSPITIVTCPIIRETDGLAMSSRNRLLDPDIRKDASLIFNTLVKAREMMKNRDVQEVKAFVVHDINKTPGFNVEYFEIADETELIPVNSRLEMISGRSYYGCIAVKAGNVRLIDNIRM